MIIVVEGVDGTGKSTLAKELSERLKIPLYDNSFMTREPELIDTRQTLVELQTAVEVATKMRGGMIFDRLHLSEMAYNEYYGREYYPQKLWLLDAMIAEVPHMGILLRYEEDRQTDGKVPTEDLQQLDKMLWDYHEMSAMRWRCFPYFPNSYSENKMDAREVLEASIYEIVRGRKSKDEVFMELAHTVLQRATCLSRRVGAVLVSPDGHVLSTGYNGAPIGVQHQCKCRRLGGQSGQCLDECDDVHAEENLIAQAAMYGKDTRDSTVYTTSSPCARCARMLINAGVKRVVYDEVYDLDVLNKWDYKLNFEVI